jgi:acetyl-CoA carboxylase biotin carboxyl carrier protein
LAIDVVSIVTGSVSKIEARVGQRLAPGDTIMVLESMKMQIPLIAEDGGVLRELRVAEGDAVAENEVVAVLEE